MLVVTVVGIAIPVWISRSEMQTKSLQMRIVSQTMLQPGSTKTVSGLKILVDSIELEHPVLSVLELANNGSMSILPSEFEASLKIMVGADAQIVRAENTSVNPENLAPKITRNTEQDFVLAPLLLNPGDTMTFAVLTAKKDPVFSVNARIVGIRNVTLENGLAHEQIYKKSLFQLFTAFFLTIRWAF